MKFILVVDDEVQLRTLVKTVLRRQHVQAEFVDAANGKEALDLLQAGFCPSLIISDIDMPVMTGLELAQHCKAEFPSIPMILCSGNPNHAATVHDLGGVGFFEKGGSYSAFPEKVKEVL
jgi:CheY-like chemotaxis protein